MDKKLFKTRDEIYKKCPSIYWELSIFGIIFAVALAALEAVAPGLYIATFGILFFPLLFAIYITLLTIKYGGTVTVKSTFNISKSYFSGGNFGCFRIIRCFLHALLVEVIADTVFTLLLVPIFKGIYGQVFTEGIEEFINALYGSDLDALNNILDSENCVTLYLECTASFSFSAGLFAFIFGICFNSLNVYLCANIPNASAAFCSAIFNRFFKRKGKQYRKDFWSLNWPVFALLLIGIVGGYALTILIDIDFAYGRTISSMVGLLFLIPFAPFFFAGMEALFAKYNEDFKKASAYLTQSYLINLKNNAQISEEDKAKIDELLSRSNEVPKDDENQEK